MMADIELKRQMFKFRAVKTLSPVSMLLPDRVRYIIYLCSITNINTFIPPPTPQREKTFLSPHCNDIFFSFMIIFIVFKCPITCFFIMILMF